MEGPRAPLEYGRARRGRVGVRAVRYAFFVATAGGLLGWGYWRSLDVRPVRGPVVTTSPTSPGAIPAPVTAPEAEGPDIDRVYAQEIVPLLDQFDARNRQAVARAVANMHERLNGRRWGIRPFIKDVSSWGTRFGVIRRTAWDLWQHKVKGRPDAAAVRTFVNDKFRHHVLSEAALEADTGEVLKQFREDLNASRNRLYVDVRLPLAKMKLPLAATDANYAAFTGDVERRARVMSESWGADSVVSGLGAFVSGWVAMEVAQGITTRAVVAILSRVGTQIATETIAAGGATAGGAAAGGGGGSLAGPAGTIIGLGVGVAVGAVIDWWMSERFEAKMTTQLNRFFDSVDGQLITGTPKAPGLEQTLNDAVTLGGQAQRDAIYKALREVQPL